MFGFFKRKVSTSHFPPTDRQIRYAAKLGIAMTPSMTSAELSAAISAMERGNPKLARQRQHIMAAVRPESQNVSKAVPAGETCWVEGFWCESNIRLDTPVATPLGGHVKLLNACVDIKYRLYADRAEVIEVRLSKAGRLGDVATNVTTPRRGEAFYIDRLDRKLLVACVNKDLEKANSHLRKAMWARWHESQKRDS